MSNDTLNPLTGTFRLKFPCRSAPKINNLAQTILVRHGAPGSSEMGALQLGSTLGGRGDGRLESSSRSLVNGYAGLLPGKPFEHFAQTSTAARITHIPTKQETIDVASPYIIFPDDELIFGWQYPMTPRIANAAPGRSDTSLNTMTPFGNSKLRLIGSLVKNATEFHETVNQNLTSDAVHEIIGAETPVDVFHLDTQGANRGNFFDRLVRSTATVPSGRIGAATVSRADPQAAIPLNLATANIRLAKPLASMLQITGFETSGIEVGDFFRFKRSDGTFYFAQAEAIIGTKTGSASDGLGAGNHGGTFGMSGLRGNSFSAAQTVLESLRDLINNDPQINTELEASMGLIRGTAHPDFYEVTLNISRKTSNFTDALGLPDGSAGNGVIGYDTTSNRRAEVSSFEGGVEGVAARGNSYSRYTVLRDEGRVFADTTGSVDPINFPGRKIGIFYDGNRQHPNSLPANVSGSSYGTYGLDVNGDGRVISPKYYFDQRTFGQYSSLAVQGRDSAFGRRISRQGGRNFVLSSPVQIIFLCQEAYQNHQG
jgi:hypothetical protein